MSRERNSSYSFYTPVWKTGHIMLQGMASARKLFRFRLTSPTVYIRSSWNLVYSETMMWCSTYYFGVTVHQMFAELCPLENFCKLSFLVNSYILHPVKLKLHIYIFYIYLDHDVEQRILFWGYSPPNISRVMPLWKFQLTSFPANSYSLHPIKLKLDL